MIVGDPCWALKLRIHWSRQGWSSFWCWADSG